MSDSITALALVAGPTVKVLLDVLRMRTIATAVLAGIWAGANAVGVTELGKRAAKK